MRGLIQQNAEEINRLQASVHETFKNRDKNENKRREWENACKEFHHKYDRLAFPGGLKGAYERILVGDHEAMEAAICFLETRPYFFRSGYMFKTILRKAKRAPLNKDQQERLEAVQKRFDEYRKHRNEMKA
ncbi:MAG: hypothetical protein IPQ16_13805 [Geobacteraceae bacterium]|nr:hypothetical protein [Geobacteraceae bacterium]